MKIVLAPDSFKGNMRSSEICAVMKQAVIDQIPDAEVITIPMADGGEGTVDAAVAATGGHLETVNTFDALGRPVVAQYGIPGNRQTAVMEMASASGIELMSPEELNPWLSTTYGTGVMIKAILQSGIRDIIIGIGGSATNDGGAGMAQALGYRFPIKNGGYQVCGCSGGGLGDICGVDTSKVMSELKEARIRVACDVNNPLLGPNGAATIYSPQKGADPEMVLKLEENMANYADVLIKAGLTDNCTHPGDGAAGGLGFGLRTLAGAKMVSGAKLMIETTDLAEHLKGADLLITGEGCTDGQTTSGKLCAVVADTAAAAGVPTVLISGALKGDLAALREKFIAALSIAPGPVSLQEALENSQENLYNTVVGLAGIFKAIKL
jgi:glycerate 2-kinase